LWQIHAGGRSTIYGVRLSGKKACLKVFTDQRLMIRLRTFLGWSKGRRAFRNGLLAYGKGVPVPCVYAYAEQRPCGPTLVVTELLENAVQMNLLLEERLARGIALTTDPVFHELVELFARFTQDLHARGVCHRDFSPRNVLVAEQNGETRLQLIDLEDIDFACSARKFRSNIEHFHGKMARYVDAAALTLFQSGFNAIYGQELSR
jgi:tRNA A-37 threonylcarbamoyl transferase component Bud32